MITNPEAYARALSAALVADMSAAPTLDKAVAGRTIDGKGLHRIIVRDLANEARGVKGPHLFPNLRKLFRTQVAVDTAQRGGMAQWEAIFTSVIPSLAGAATKYATAKIESAATVKIGKIQLQAQQLAVQSQNIQAQAARTAQAIAEGNPAAADASSIASQIGIEGLPGWVLPVGLGVLALGGLAIFLARKNPLPIKRRRVA